MTMNIAISDRVNKQVMPRKAKLRSDQLSLLFQNQLWNQSHRTDKNKDEFISVTCRYRPSAGDSKKNNYVIQAKRFETGTTEDVLRWYITLQEIFEKKPCEDAEAKFGMVELLLGGQG